MGTDDDVDGPMRRLTSGLSHELRNPITAALLQLEVLERRIAPVVDARTREPLQLARGELERAMELLAQILAYARPAPLDRRLVDALELARHIAAVETPSADLRGVAIDVSGDPALAELDPARIAQVLQNVVRNAIEASDDGDTVRITVTKSGTGLRVRITDEGPAVPPDVRARMFEPFFTTKRRGTGLGLAIVKSFVEQHGGTVELDSDARGTIVTLSFP